MVNLSDINYKLYELDSKLKLLVIPNNTATIISLGMFIEVGSLKENDNELGVAHFLEHMMFKGSKKYVGSLTNRLDELGVIYNATTSFEYTEYELHGLIDYIDELIFILLDMFYNAEIPENSIDIEREIILQEYNMRNDNNSYKLYSSIIQLITQKKNQLYGRPIIGNVDSIKNITYDDLINFRKKYYIDRNATITISGNIDYNIISKIESIYYKVTTNKVKFNLIDYKLKTIDIKDELFFDDSPKITINNRVTLINSNINQYNILIVFPCWKKFNKNTDGLNIISSILTDGMSGRITKSLRENNGLSYSQSSSITQYNDFGMFNISIGVNKKFLYKSIRLIVKELVNLYNNGIKKYELNKSRNINMTNLLLFFQKQMSLFNYLTETIVYNQEVDSIKDVITKYNNYDIDSINKIIREIFNPKQMYISICGSDNINFNKIRKIMKYFNDNI